VEQPVVNVCVIYYSATGTVHALARAVAEGAEKAGASVRLLKVAETAPPQLIATNDAWGRNIEATADVPVAGLEDLEWADAVVFGTPTRFGTPAAQLKAFIDGTGPLWRRNALAGKVFSAFTSSGTPHGGQESTILGLSNVFYHWGGIIVPPGYTDPIQFRTGNPYGTSHTAGLGLPDDVTLEGARHQGRHVVDVAAALKAGRKLLAPPVITAADVYEGIEASAGLLGVPVDRDRIWPVLITYEDALADSVTVFSMGTRGDETGELDYTITVPPGSGPDPFEVAGTMGFVAPTEHPVGRLLADIKERCPIRGYAIDVGVVAGFKKTYSFFPLDELQTVAKLATLPSAPPGLAAVGEIFTGYGLDANVTMVGIDHQHETMNVYFGRFDTELVEAATVQKMLAELGLPAATEEALDFIRRAFAVYFTIGWEKPEVERICYAVITRDPRLLPARKDAEIARFADNSAIHDDERIMTYGITIGPGGESYKLGTYFRMAPETRRLLAAFDAID
jgi:NAD(P)H dehydrogenase (quinone)